MRVKIYQVDHAADTHRMIFQGLAAFEKQYGGRIPVEIYTLVFDGELEVRNPEQVFVMLNVNHPAGYTGRSLSMSDVVEFVDDGVSYFCDFIGFKKVRFERESKKGECAMTVWNNGTLTVDKPMSEEVCEKIHDLFHNDPGVYAEGQTITIEDTPDYRLDESQKLQNLLAEYGISIQKDSSVKYYGDYDGYYVWTGSKFESMDYWEYALYSLTDEELYNKLRERGYCVCKEPGACQKQM